LNATRLDATDVLEAALRYGEDPFFSDRTHLNEDGHRIIADWLHERLPRLVPSKGAREAPDEEGE
jgi:lysophospholipase L1-like esterase